MRRSIPWLLAVTFSLGALHAQTVSPPTTPPVPSPPLAGVTASPAQDSGTITHFLVNPNGDIDGLLLQDGMQVPTPPPLSARIMASLHVGDTVHVAGHRMGALPLIAQAQITSASRAVVVSADPPPAPPPSPPALVPLTASGTVDRPIYGPAGDITGALLSDGTQLRMPRPAADRFQSLLQPGSTLSVRGFGIDSRWGRSIQVTAIGRNTRSEMDVTAPDPGAPLPQ